MSDQRQVLDHGYVQFIEDWGSDSSIVEAARMSTNKGFQGWGREGDWECPTCGYKLSASLERSMPPRPTGTNLFCPNAGHHAALVKQPDVPGDEKLLRYLYTHGHMSPFEMGGMVIEVQAPIFVFREWHRHRTQSYNELSARYTPLPDVNYVPTVERLMMSGGGNKQAQGLKEINTLAAKDFRSALDRAYASAQTLYRLGLNSGVPKELARLIVPVGRYSRMRASANLRNWLQFLTLRMDVAAQWEIRQYAFAVGDLIAAQFPRTWELFVEGRS